MSRIHLKMNNKDEHFERLAATETQVGAYLSERPCHVRVVEPLFWNLSGYFNILKTIETRSLERKFTPYARQSWEWPVSASDKKCVRALGSKPTCYDTETPVHFSRLIITRTLTQAESNERLTPQLGITNEPDKVG